MGSFHTNPSLVSMPEILKKNLFVLPVIPPQILKPWLLTSPSPLEGILHALSDTTPTLGPHPSCHWCQSQSLVFSVSSLPKSLMLSYRGSLTLRPSYSQCPFQWVELKRFSPASP